MKSNPIDDQWYPLDALPKVLPNSFVLLVKKGDEFRFKVFDTYPKLDEVLAEGTGLGNPICSFFMLYQPDRIEKVAAPKYRRIEEAIADES